ncbi:hypothetical protein DP149_04495 [Clostridium tetani]|uniref:Uncharacterized protein n=1 Tax=Clostridium tetani (strain Massachusetts / E88) TaxID=212717 RepID=Q898B6_CLOTE|nr:hypothetical protein [Clostridium tetani]AAO35167.1 hypothetical protein CTC_00547 [Clostridium tetani E88]KGI36377.1 hypothetical protein KY52_13925 [Clostridium tetani]KGI37541.1 hypothetical protein LA33_11895 [Clostridium tetani ATCC 9441]KGI46138.1 hypothetical protein KY54_02345 [Clostridium tetani]KHO37985.1 hypothetical protein OR63_02530 [Clostridium tetani]
MYVEGITSQDKISKYELDYPRKEICLNFQFRIPEEDQDIGKIEKVILENSIVENKRIETQGQYKVFFHGLIDIKLIYTSAKEDSKRYLSNIQKSLASFIPVEVSSINGEGDSKKEPIMFVEEVLVNKLNNREISISLLILACTVDRKVEEKENKATPLKIMEEETKKMLERAEDKNKIKEKNIKIDNSKSGDVDIELEYDMAKENGFFEISWE